MVLVSVILKIKLFTFILVTAIIHFPSSKSNGVFIEKVTTDFLDLLSEVSCSLVFVWLMSQSLIFQLKIKIHLSFLKTLQNSEFFT